MKKTKKRFWEKNSSVTYGPSWMTEKGASRNWRV